MLERICWKWAIAAFASASAVSVQVDAAPKWVRLSIVHDPATTMTVAWHTIDPVTSNVRYGTDSAKLDKTAKGASKLGAGSLGYIHEAEMTGLQPGTKYYYQVGEDADGWSAVLSMRTAPAQHQDCGKHRFIFLGDNRPDSILGLGDNWSSILEEAVAEDPGFVLSGGDLVYAGTENSEWVDFLDWTGEPARYSPFMPTMGNHDDDTVVGDGAQYNQIFALPRSAGTGSSGTEDYYFFTYGNSIVVSINTQQYKGGASAFADQAAWLDEVLTNNPRRWKFVVLHHPIYTDNTMLSHPPNEQGQNSALVPIFDKHHVDFVLQSHNHWYERFEPSNCSTSGNPGSDNACPVGADAWDKGTAYLTSGGAGAITILWCGSATGLATCKTDHHYVIFDIDNESIHMQTWASSQQTWSSDPSNHKLIDEVQYAKSGAVCPSGDAGLPDAEADAPVDSALADAAEASTPDAVDAPDKPDAAKDAGPAKPDASPSHPDVGASDEPVPGSVSTPSADANAGDAGGCACTSGAAPPRTWQWLVAALAGSALLARRRKRTEPRRT
ncbi:MAG: fibronectin type III domain-containing protein [Deltaproteobacteria bacterium]|nr:fibronectin type III domain-containing protein [Deltaproteobacteria bacterium]